MMKKLAAAALVLSLAVPAFAAETAKVPVAEPIPATAKQMTKQSTDKTEKKAAKADAKAEKKAAAADAKAEKKAAAPDAKAEKKAAKAE